MKDLLSKEHYCYKIHTLPMKSSAYLPFLQTNPHFHKKILILPCYDFSNIPSHPINKGWGRGEGCSHYERQLNNNAYYNQLSKDQTAAKHETVKNVNSQQCYRNVSKGKSNYQNAAKGLKTISPQITRLYIQPKIHQHGNPGRTVISS